MGKKSRMSILKRQRELKKSDKAAHKRAKRHGISMTPDYEPQPTITGDQLRGIEPIEGDDSDGTDETETAEDEPTTEKTEP